MEHPSPTPSGIPRVRFFEFHDLPYVPYALNFAMTRLLEKSWTHDFSRLRPFVRFYLNNIYSSSPSSSSEEFDSKFSHDDDNNPTRFCDGLAELLDECFIEVEKARSSQLRKKQESSASEHTDVKTATPFFPCRRILDLCSGAGGPSFMAAKTLSENLPSVKAKREAVRKNPGSAESALPPSAMVPHVHLTVSDLFPHPDHWTRRCTFQSHLRVDFQNRSVDATNVDPSVAPHSVWTINAAFHHFDSPLAEKILRSAIENENSCDGILITEISEHRLLPMLFICPILFVLTWLLPFYVIPWKEIPKHFFLYLQILAVEPFLSFTAIWDTIVSCMRTMMSHELLALAKKVDVENKMEWHAAARDYIPGFHLAPSLVYLRGVRKMQ